MKGFAFQVADRLKAEIPGLTTHVDYGMLAGAKVLHGR